jgi:hypothetical protein
MGTFWLAAEEEEVENNLLAVLVHQCLLLVGLCCWFKKALVTGGGRRVHIDADMNNDRNHSDIGRLPRGIIVIFGQKRRMTNH